MLVFIQITLEAVPALGTGVFCQLLYVKVHIVCIDVQLKWSKTQDNMQRLNQSTIAPMYPATMSLVKPTLMSPGISYISNIDLMLLNIIFFIIFPLHQNRLQKKRGLTTSIHARESLISFFQIGYKGISVGAFRLVL